MKAVELAGTRASRPVTLRAEQRCIKALYTGGSLASEAAMLLGDALGVPVDAEHPAGSLLRAGGHEVIDLGDDVYTRGRPHPMIDPSLRNDRLPAVFDDPETAVLLLDVVLGFGSDPDPAGALAVYQGLQIPWEKIAASQRAVHAAVLGANGKTAEAMAEASALRWEELRPEERELVKPWRKQ